MISREEEVKEFRIKQINCDHLFFKDAGTVRCITGAIEKYKHARSLNQKTFECLGMYGQTILIVTDEINMTSCYSRQSALNYIEAQDMKDEMERYSDQNFDLL